MKINYFLAISTIFSISFLSAFAQEDKSSEGKLIFKEVNTDQKYPPMPLPEWKPPNGEMVDEHIISTYNVFTKEVTLSKIENIFNDQYMSTIGNSGADDKKLASLEGTSLDGFSNLQQVSIPEDYPWRVNCKLILHWGSIVKEASGVLIDAKHVLTAGHCVYFLDFGGWADYIEVIPAYKNGDKPFGNAFSIQLTTFYGWAINEDFNHDMGIIELNRPVGALTGWHGYGYNNDNNFFYQGNFNNPGYPDDPPYSGQIMYNWYGYFDYVETYILFNDQFCYGGQSGSGTYYLNGSNNIVYSELSFVTSEWAPGIPFSTGHVRITPTKYSVIQSTISDNTPTNFDLIPLSVEISTNAIQQGEQLSSMSYYIHNYSSSASTGTVSVDIYLSADSTISSADALINTHSIPGTLNGKATWLVSVTDPPTIPYTVSPGEYYIGIILDINDYNTDNNETDGQDAHQITVLQGPFSINPMSNNVSSNSGSYSVAVSTNASWSISDSCDWVTCNPVFGSGDGSFTVTYTENTLIDPRSCTITVSGEGGFETHTICQDGAPAYIILNPISNNVSYDSGSYSVGVSSNASWTISESCDWVTCNPLIGNGDGSFTVTYTENTSIDPRSCTITVSGEGESETHIISQDGAPYILLNPISNNVSYESDSYSVGVSSNANWSINESCDWLTCNPVSGSGDGLFSLNYSENSTTDPRSCTITVSGEGVSETHTITQAGTPYIILNPISKNVSYYSGSYSVVVGSNTSWSISESCDWVTCNPLIGSGDGSFSISFTENTLIDPRSCYITVSDGSISETHTLTQLGGFQIILELDIKVFLAGPFIGSYMIPFQNYVDFPLTQPFQVSPWNYMGVESLGLIPNNDIVDWVLLEYRDAADVSLAISSTMIHQQAALLLNNGKIVDLDGQSNISFDQNISQNLYLIVWHRNHLGIISAYALTQTGGIYNYDFTSTSDQAFGGTFAQTELAPGMWGMIGADGDASGEVGMSDVNNVWKISAGKAGYRSADYNLDGEVDNKDKDEIWLPSLGSSTQIPGSDK